MEMKYCLANRFPQYLLILVLTLLLGGCSQDDAIDDEPVAIKKQITILFSPGGVGDMGYNDQILRGVLKVWDESKFDLLISAPNSLEEGEKKFVEWLEQPQSQSPSLFVLAANEYEEMAERLLSSGQYHDKEVLLFETRKHDIPMATSFSVTMYGACYQAGGLATLFTDKAAVMCANSSDLTVTEGANGFAQGFIDNGGIEVPLYFLADTWHGYAMPDAAYKLTAQLAPDYRYIFPIAGGSNMGVYHYSREYPYGFFTAGMDVDQSQLSTQITCSIVKHIDRLIVDYITKWVDGEPLPQNQVYGLQSGYIEVVLSDYYKEACQNRLLELQTIAIKKEEEHEKSYH